MSRCLVAAASLSIVAFTGCDCGPLPIDSKKYACQTTADCAPGDACVLGVCEADAGHSAADASTDGGEPDADAGRDAGTDGGFDGGDDGRDGGRDGGSDVNDGGDGGDDGGSDAGLCTLSSMNPTLQGAGGVVTIVGSNLENPSAVTFGGGPDAGVTSSSASTLVVSVPEGSASGAVVVTTPSGPCSLDGFVFAAPPSITSFAPQAQRVGADVTITGTDLGFATSVTFGGGPAATIVSNSSTQIVATVPLGSSSGTVAVTTPGGTATKTGFVLLPQPSIVALIPSVQRVDGLVTIVGSNLAGATDIHFGAGPAATIVKSGSTLVQVRVPSGSTSGTVTLTAAGGGAQKSGFVLDTPPRATAIVSPSNSAVVFGCVAVSYTVAQSDSLPADIVVEYDVNGSSFAAATRCTQARGLPGVEPFGVQGVPTSPTGTTHVFLWNSTADLAGVDTSGVALRVRAHRHGAFGSSTAQVTNLTIANGLRFAPAQPIRVGEPQQGLAVADITLDGRLDLVTTMKTSGATGLLLGAADGGFDPPQQIAAGFGASAYAVDDFNLDGKPDFAVLNSTTAAAQLFLNGIGNVGLDAGVSPVAFAVADFNRDGLVDTAVASGSANQVAVMLHLPGASAFAGPVTYAVGTNPTSIAVGDLNRDGRIDIVVANRTSNTVSVLLANGAGTFAAATSYTIDATSPAAVVVTDFNGDGFLDVATANAGSSSISLLAGNGSGGFGAATQLPSATNPDTTLLAADLNGDGRVELITASLDTNNVFVHFRGIATPLQFSVGNRPVALAVADVNRDGKLDIISVNDNENDATLLLNTQARRCSTMVDGPIVGLVGGNPLSTATGDLNGDGKLDVVTANYASNDVSMLLGFGDGLLAAGVSLTADVGPSAVAVDDLNGDMKLDLAVVNFSSQTVSVLLGTGNATFASAVSYAVGLAPRSVAIADMTLDGIPDLVVGSATDSTVTVLKGNGNGTFAPATTSTLSRPISDIVAADFDGDLIPDVFTGGLSQVEWAAGDLLGHVASVAQFDAGPQPISVAVCELNRDGVADVVATSATQSKVVLVSSTPSGPRVSGTRDVGVTPLAVATADLDNNGASDLITVNHTSQDFSILLASDAGVFGPLAAYPVAGRSPSDLCIADLNGDGHPDVVSSSNFSSSAPGVVATNTVTVVLGRGDGTLLPRRFGTGVGPTFVAAGDVNRDGVLDIVNTNFTSANIAVQLGAADGGFGLGAPVFLSTGAVTPYAIELADLNRDGKLDVVSTLPTTGQLAVHLGVGDGTFGAAQLSTVGSSPARLAVADLNFDGILDVAVANQGTNNVSMLIGLGNGAFSPAQNLAAGVAPTGIVAGHLNHDALIDLAVANAGSANVTVLMASAPGVFSPAATLATGLGPVSIAAGDLNNDGWVDLATGNSASASFSVFYGGSTGFGAQVTTNVGAGQGAVTIADFDGDGIFDIIASLNEANAVVVARSSGTGGQPGLMFLGAGNTGVGVLAVDLNRDGRRDVVTMSYDSIVTSLGVR